MLPISNPTIIIFERHWGTVPKQVVLDLLSPLSQEGYDTFTLEVPSELSKEEIVSRHARGLSEDLKIQQDAEGFLQKANIRHLKPSSIGFFALAKLMQNYVSTQYFNLLAEKIKGIPGALTYKALLSSAQHLSIQIKWIDIEERLLHEITGNQIFGDRTGAIKKHEDKRILSFSENIVRLIKEKRGTIFLCGATHAQNLIQKLNALAHPILYYFPHSFLRYDPNTDDIYDYTLELNPSLQNHNFSLINDSDIKDLSSRIVLEVRRKNQRHLLEILGGTQSSRLLNHHFKVNFKAYERIDHYVDAVLQGNPSLDFKALTEKLASLKITTETIPSKDKTYLVVRNINVAKISLNIDNLSSTTKTKM